MTVEITCKVRGNAFQIPFEKIAVKILGKKYSLSLVLSGDKLARRINRTYRKKDYPSNVLSFPLGSSESEIFLNVRKAEREARQFGITARERVALLFIHGCLHLRGMKHGHKMEVEERTVLKRFGFK
ncbi:rRNA maturation RNase YbeY [Candidatus Kaiserbacteria bacterium RIFCSPHIGHO2_02_FULL_49_16]|uniref:Endoribonuclease YbeY n=1 Tax=Candidatus Kaiserbacteria bacterium RIFCSPHIGHO2_02_FULL_49_16 TaxID=1798490 RepID=A0A1F6DHT2_9BACT|nr:MAG: rRNA maturation RNase YbeY [Candidatus Kaiserbacteria bacterium RIFCSPHIGHO2_02_FULL_49_16]